MSSSGFLSTSNTEMLWNIIMDDVVTTTFNENMVMKYIRDVFHKNLAPFFEIERTNTNDLIVLNKKYISWLLATINAFTKKNNNKTKNDDNKLITVEDIHKNRQTQFEQDLNDRQQEFTNYMTVKTPEVPKFSIDLSEDIPIKELEQTIKQMAAQRNYDVAMINNNNTNPVDAQNWLTPKETSVKNEKHVHDKSTNNVQDKVKYIKIDTINLDSSHHNNIVDLNKHITWQDQLPSTNANESNTNESNIFTKLKKINSNDLKDVNLTSMQNDIREMQTKISDMNDSIVQILRLLHKNE
jgi:hypothetical protein